MKIETGSVLDHLYESQYQIEMASELVKVLDKPFYDELRVTRKLLKRHQQYIIERTEANAGTD